MLLFDWVPPQDSTSNLESIQHVTSTALIHFGIITKFHESRGTMRFSTLLYIFEPDVNVDSMFTAMWVSTVTVTTVGYGDITPITLSGKMPLCLALSDGLNNK